MKRTHVLVPRHRLLSAAITNDSAASIENKRLTHRTFGFFHPFFSPVIREIRDVIKPQTRLYTRHVSPSLLVEVWTRFPTGEFESCLLCPLYHQVSWPASTSKIEECQMAGKDPTVRTADPITPLDWITGGIFRTQTIITLIDNRKKKQKLEMQILY